MEQWEYLEELITPDKKNVPALLNRQGHKGWELVTILLYPTVAGYQLRCYFKRRVSPPPIADPPTKRQ